MSRLLQLPREIRDLVYEHYFRGAGGFVYDFAANKLRRADGHPIELALVLTCRHVAAEAHGLALRVNTLRFTTFHSDDTQEHASLLHLFNLNTRDRKETLLNSLAPDFLSWEQAQAMKSLHPHFAPVIDHWRAHGKGWEVVRLFVDCECSLTPSIWHDFVASTLNLVSQHPEFLSKARRHAFDYMPVDSFGTLPARTPEQDLYDDNRTLSLCEARPMPWQITHMEELAELRELTKGPSLYGRNIKYTYSAASAALRLLQSMPKAARDNIRKVLLIEDRESIAFPQSHGTGFIDICRNHPQLKVERFVSLWGNALPMSDADVWIHRSGCQDFLDKGYQTFDGCDANSISKGVGTWIMEARALPSLGMPHGSFTLVLDGDPLPEQTSQVFKIIQRDAAWQTALDICYARRILPRPSWFEQRVHSAGFIHEDFPEAVGAISLHSSLIRTNFPVCAPYDVEQLLREHEGWTPNDWEAGWALHEPREFLTEAPLPPWHQLRWQHVIRFK